jgi:heme-degrading monooxygenase HmoA
MYGTAALCTVSAENLGALRALMADQERGEGFLGLDMMEVENHPNTVLIVVRFQDRDSYMANAESPGQDERYQRMRALMDVDPVWYDGQWTPMQ